MAERATGRPWTAEEDELLQRAVAKHGENDMWKTIALCVPGRTNKACRKRWLHSLSPTVKKTPWTKEEDALLLSLYAVHGIKWALIARSIPGRTDDACSKRYREALDPSLKKDEWTVDEDNKLLEAYARVGGKWSIIGQELQRSSLGCRNRWRLLQRKQSKLISAPTAAPVQQYLNPWEMPMLDDYWAAQFQEYDPDPSLLSQGYPDGNHDLDPGGPSYTPSDLPTAPNVSPADGAPFHTSISLTNAFNSSVGHLNTVFHASESSSHNSTGFLSPDDAAYELPSRESHCRSTPHPSDRNEVRSPFPDSPDTGNVPTGVLSEPSWNRESIPALDLGSQSFPARPESRSDNRNQVASPTAAPSDEGNAPSADTTHPTVGSSTNVQASASSPAPRTTSIGRPPKRQHGTNKPLQRLSATLTVSSDPTVRPYACGHPICWPAGSDTSLSAFVTSGELVEHGRTAHPDDMTASPKPFRCSLEGCGKAWASVNGLQYHLQISKTHFQRALNSVTISKDITAHAAEQGQESHAMEDTDEQRPVKKRKIHQCPHTDCPNQYKQLSGLRYHLAHAHVHALPTQLQDIPPTLARRKVIEG